MNIRQIENTHAPNRFGPVETSDADDVLGRMAAALEHRARCRAAIAHHSRNSAGLARAEWLIEHEQASAKLAELLPQAERLLANLKREVLAFADTSRSTSELTSKAGL